MKTPGSARIHVHWLWVVAGFWVSAACTPGGAVGAALYRDLPTLKQEIERARAKGAIDAGLLKAIARAVVVREIHSSWGPKGIRQVRQVSACAASVLGELRQRSAHADDVAAQAMLIRIAQNDVDREKLVIQHHDSENPAWRAVAARAATHPEDYWFRRRSFEDPDERVRRAALEAAMLAPDPFDLPALLEAFRLDPDPLARSLAARAAGGIGGEPAVQGLSDSLARAELPEQLAVVDAWSKPASFRAGGARALRKLLEARQGLLSIAAARALLESNASGGGSVVGHLLMAASHGTEEERRLAIGFLPLTDARSVPTLVEQSADPSQTIQVAALSRLLAVPEQRKRALSELRKLAKDTGSAREARAELASFGDRSVVPLLIRDRDQAHPFWRRSAALMLVRLGEHSAAAKSLADADPGVRVAVSCAIVGANQR